MSGEPLALSDRLRGSVSVVASVSRTSWFQIAAICARSDSRAARILTRSAGAALRAHGGGHDFSSAKQPPASGIDAGTVQAVLREDLERVVALFHARMIPWKPLSGKSIVLIVTIRYFLILPS